MQTNTESWRFMTNPEIIRGRDRICRSWEIYGAITSALELECLHRARSCSQSAILDLRNEVMFLFLSNVYLDIYLKSEIWRDLLFDYLDRWFLVQPSWSMVELIWTLLWNQYFRNQQKCDVFVRITKLLPNNKEKQGSLRDWIYRNHFW